MLLSPAGRALPLGWEVALACVSRSDGRVAPRVSGSYSLPGGVKRCFHLSPPCSKVRFPFRLPSPHPLRAHHHPPAPLSFVLGDSRVSWALRQERDVRRHRCELTKTSEPQAAGWRASTKGSGGLVPTLGSLPEDPPLPPASSALGISSSALGATNELSQICI